MGGVLVGLIIFVVLIVAHEYGHFLAAKLNKVEVEEFGVGFPPKLYGKKIGKGIFRSYYSVNLLPLGGFVRLKGESESDKSKGSFGAASFRSKFQIITAGVIMNLLVAVVIFTALASVGMPQFTENQFAIASQVTSDSYKLSVVEVSDSSPADKAGIKRGSVINSVDNKQISTEADLFSALEGKDGQQVEISYSLDGSTTSSFIELAQKVEGEGVLGVVPLELQEVKHSILGSVAVGIGTTVQFSWLTLVGILSSLTSLVTGNVQQAADNVAGPVGIFSIFSSLSLLGIKYVLYFGGIISVTLAVMNILPLPALDGGRLFISIVINKLKIPLSQSKEQLIHITGFVFLMILAVLITVVDIGRI